MVHYNLETPETDDALYMARGSDVEELRPAFTGDIYQYGDGLLMLVQHPCALRRGAVLHEHLLAVEVRSTSTKPRSSWENHTVSEMPLPGLQDGHSIADFLGVQVVKSDALTDVPRMAVLSERGVNLLLQRWVYHCSRVVVPTITYNEQTYGPFNEAELTLDWLMEREGVLGRDEALKEFDAWVRGTSETGQKSRQRRLADRQEANAVRREARAHLKTI
ncbi:hypothetical protein GR168_22055 [Gordonia sp. JH63]|uniref:hypothetical protein n=1 Tax=Gordonia TaxID=2053 RepID=UPI00131F5C65|nr:MULTISPECIES: hypothetical protein [Gordonia]MCZ0915276.1 hypothetical protein [Gordonia amicalis]QHD87769.1 hypothetical protein GR168_22055 [Gordonia sp. JH63]